MKALISSTGRLLGRAALASCPPTLDHQVDGREDEQRE
jgi:hypothetical protein